MHLVHLCRAFAGQVLLKQGKEVSEIHCLTSGSLLLTYAPPTNTAAAAAARASLGGAISPPLCNNNDSMPGVHSAATAAAVAASAGADASAAGASSAAAAAIIAAVAAGGVSANGAGLAAAAGMKRTSGLADLLRLGQQTIQPAAVVGMRYVSCFACAKLAVLHHSQALVSWCTVSGACCCGRCTPIHAMWLYAIVIYDACLYARPLELCCRRKPAVNQVQSG